VWRLLPGDREASVHMALFPRELAPWHDQALLDRWSALGSVRDEVNLQLEQKRQEKVIAANLSARVTLTASGDTARLLTGYEDFLPTLFGVSQVRLAGDPSAADGVRVSVEKAEGIKCERCWRYVPEVSQSPEFAGLCSRCVDALAEPVSL
jgi:isoleucyl-tRNA synthetase